MPPISALQPFMRRPVFIYFDLDDTILDHHAAQEAALTDVFTELDWGEVALEDLRDVYHRVNVKLWELYGAHKINKQTLNHRRFAETIGLLSAEQVEEAHFRSRYLTAYARHWTFVAGAEQALLKIARHYPIGIMTNGFREIQQAKFDRFPLLHHLAQHLVISEEVGIMKPQPGIFAHAAELVKAAPQDLLYVGDSWTSDVIGSTQAGWQAAWFQKTPHQKTLPEQVFAFTNWQTLVHRLCPEPERTDR